ncbi:MULTISPECIES: MBL fold metallo-hydrolase [Streptomyces]|uniref:MBL fold metallo-hydrolase n=1 Tax=Streptomyces TaxID=1883 RepID=UPI000BEFF78B|nr:MULTISPECIES: MBL fold metallo-hydrolase [unclassified Streptomyces]MBK3542080.1 MBL fold metallo-hydrolase [Streptomyces sp. MBT60]MCA1268716.1 MBL fold metallo-hydrolase [Streptomyces sp. 7G]
MSAPGRPAGSGLAAPAPDPVRAPFPRLREIAEGVHVYEQLPGGWCLNNAGLVAGADRSLLVDTVATRARALHLREETRRVVPGGPDFVVNTHFHGDHVFGNEHFVPRAAVISHEQTRSDIEEAGLGLCHLWPGVDWGEPRLTLPDVTFREAMTLRLGGLTVELLEIGPAHTASDVVAWVPERRVLFTGDVIWSGVTPFLLMGSVEGSLAAVERLRALGPETVVPGHGAVAGTDALDATEAYVRRLRGIAEDGLRAGLSPLQAAGKADLGPFAALVDPERLAGNLHRAYAELEGLPPGERIDVAAGFGDMVEFNGGLPFSAA